MKLAVVGYGLVRSLAMLNVTLQSFENNSRHADFVVAADCRENCSAATSMFRAAGARHVWLRHRTPASPTLAHFKHSCKNRLHQTNALHYLYAMQLLGNGIEHAARARADAIVAWRVDTRLVTPIDAEQLGPWDHGRIFTSPEQGGAGLFDRFLMADAETLRDVTRYRLNRLKNLTMHEGWNMTCLYGEPLLLNAVVALNMTVGFTRTRVVRVRADLTVPDVDRALVLHEIPPRGWMKGMNRMPAGFNCTKTTCVSA